MSCNCVSCPNLVTVTAIALSGGETTLTVPADTVFTSGSTYCLGIFVDVPVGTNGTQISVTNGSSTWTIMNKLGNYYRPCGAVRERALIKVKFYDDPEHFLKV